MRYVSPSAPLAALDRRPRPSPLKGVSGSLPGPSGGAVLLQLGLERCRGVDLRAPLEELRVVLGEGPLLELPAQLLDALGEVLQAAGLLEQLDRLLVLGLEL